MIPKLMICIFCFWYILFFLVIWHWTVVKALACSGTYCKTIEKKMTYLCCSIENNTNERETTVGIRRQDAHCGWGGELKDGGPVFIYKCPYFCVLFCKLLYVELDRSRDVFLGSVDEAVSKIQRTAEQQKYHMSGCLMFGVTVISAQLKALLTVQGRCRNNLFSLSTVRSSCLESELLVL